MKKISSGEINNNNKKQQKNLIVKQYHTLINILKER